MSDLKLAFRSLRRAPGFTAAVVVALGLGIGGTSALFSVLDTVVLRPLPFRDPERLVRLYEVRAEGDDFGFAPADYADTRRLNGALQAVGGYMQQGLTLLTPGGAEPVQVGFVTSSFLGALGVAPMLGREFTADEEIDGKDNVAVLTEQLWRRRFNADPNLIGKSVHVSGRDVNVVGILPRDFRFEWMQNVELLLPLSFSADDAKNHGAHMMSAFGRLKPGASVESASAEQKRIVGLIAQENALHVGWSGRATPLRDDLTGAVRPALIALLSAVALVLLIACVNVASMLLARGASRRHEVAVRAALGGGRGQIARQHLTEALLLGLCGGALGLMLAYLALQALVAFGPRDIPRLAEASLDYRVVGLGLLLSLITGLGAGIIPALQASRPDLLDSLRSGSQNGPTRMRLRSALVVGEVALALVLVVGASLLIRSFRRVLEQPLGMDPDNLLTATITLQGDQYQQPKAVIEFFRALQERAASMPSVTSAAVGYALPLTGGHGIVTFEVEGNPPPGPGHFDATGFNPITPDYLAALKIPITKGRGFTSTDSDAAPKVVLVNEAFARKFLAGRDPIGAGISMGLGRGDAQKGYRRVVGVVSDVRYQALDKPAGPEVYLPHAQMPFERMNIVLRTAGNPMALLPTLRAEVRAIDASQALARARTFEEVMNASVGQRRFQMLLLGIFAAVALVLAAVGLHGVMAYLVVQRTQEIGVRMALGATATQVLWLVVSRALALTGAGIALGLLLSVALTRVLGALLFGISPTDPSTLLTVSALLLLVAGVASFVPARRATAVDPMVALRAE